MGTALVVLINDVTLMKGDQIIVQVCFKGGATRTPHLPAPLHASDAHRTEPEILQKIDHLLNDHTTGRTAGD